MSYATALPAKSIIVELGSLMGKSARHLVAGAIYSESTLYCVDPFEDGSSLTGLPTLYKEKINKVYGTSSLSAFQHNLLIITGAKDNTLKLVKATSKQAAKEWKGGTIDLLFIDANHEECQQDYEHWEQHLGEHAVIGLHDVHFTGNYGMYNPSNTYMYLLQKGYHLTNAAITTAFFTKDPTWWQTRFEATADHLDINTRDWFAGGRRGAPSFDGHSGPGHSSSNDTERVAPSGCKPTTTEVNP